jgi:hypothetical protein
MLIYVSLQMMTLSLTDDDPLPCCVRTLCQKENMRSNLMLIFLQNCYGGCHSIRILKELIGFNPLF